MSDDRLRELERRARQTGAVEDEAEWLRERVRCGRLAPERLALAAYLDHAAARLACCDESLSGPQVVKDDDLGPWVAGLGRWPMDVSVRAGVAVSRHLVHGVDPGLYGMIRLLPVLDAVEAWTADPSEARAKYASRKARTFARRLPSGEACGLPWRGILAISDCLRDLDRRLRRKRRPTVAMANDIAHAVLTAALVREPRELVGAIRRALIPWALA